MKGKLDTLMCFQLLRTIELNSDFKVKFLVLIHQALNSKKSTLVLRKG